MKPEDPEGGRPDQVGRPLTEVERIEARRKALKRIALGTLGLLGTGILASCKDDPAKPYVEYGSYSEYGDYNSYSSYATYSSYGSYSSYATYSSYGSYSSYATYSSYGSYSSYSSYFNYYNYVYYYNYYINFAT